MCQWWTANGVGVCALVGIGGSGKTAIVERFLRVLPNVLPESPGIAKHDAMPTPKRLFVFSFYDAPNADSFFASLAAWLQGSVVDMDATPPSYQQILLWLQQAGPCLLVLDGIEKIQDDGMRGGVFGQLLDYRLGDLVLRLASGYIPGVSTLATTRFPISELEEELPLHYVPMPIEDISDEVAIALLRQRGVKGSDVELRHLAKDCGHHALTVDLAGGYIAEFGGETHLQLGTVEELQQAVRDEPNAQRRRVLRQEYRFARIAARYREAFIEKDQAALALLERVCLFRLGIDAETLTAIFIGRDKTKISNPALARLSPRQLQIKLDLLVEMRLL